jgi:hypothetical protein
MDGLGCGGFLPPSLLGIPQTHFDTPKTVGKSAESAKKPESGRPYPHHAASNTSQWEALQEWGGIGGSPALLQERAKKPDAAPVILPSGQRVPAAAAAASAAAAVSGEISSEQAVFDERRGEDEETQKPLQQLHVGKSVCTSGSSHKPSFVFPSSDDAPRLHWMTEASMPEASNGGDASGQLGEGAQAGQVSEGQYEALRAANIKRNYEIMRALGLDLSDFRLPTKGKQHKEHQSSAGAPKSKGGSIPKKNDASNLKEEKLCKEVPLNFRELPLNFREVEREWRDPTPDEQVGGKWLVGKYVRILWEDDGDDSWNVAEVVDYESDIGEDSHGQHGPLHHMKYFDGDFTEVLNDNTRWQIAVSNDNSKFAMPRGGQAHEKLKLLEVCSLCLTTVPLFANRQSINFF